MIYVTGEISTPQTNDLTPDKWDSGVSHGYCILWNLKLVVDTYYSYCQGDSGCYGSNIYLKGKTSIGIWFEVLHSGDQTA